MLHVLDSMDAASDHAALRAMFAARKTVFVDLLKWDVPVIDDRYEIDEFDDVHAVYLILTDGDGSHLGSARLLPTLRPHILGTLYPELCTDAVPRGSAIREITRFCLDRSLNARERRAVRDTLVTALVEHALDHGIAGYTAIAELGWFQQILSFGWRCRPLGLPRLDRGTMLAALEIAVAPETPALLRRAGIHPQFTIDRRRAA